MSAHKHIDKICCVITVFAIIITVAFMNGESLGIGIISSAAGYSERLFDTSKVHTIDIIMDDWDSFIESCTDEEYVMCAVVIDGEAYKNVAIRAKGNTSLSQVKNYNSERYSFKVEFDRYDSTKTYYGLDKLSLNNIIQDNTYMKDYMSYTMMGYFGVCAPLCSYAYITVNGEDWGLYLAVEGIEDAFLERCYGSDYGELYKPDSESMGGGRGNGENFDTERIAENGENFDMGKIAENGEEMSGFDMQNGGFEERGMKGEGQMLSPPDGEEPMSDIFGENPDSSSFRGMKGEGRMLSPPDGENGTQTFGEEPMSDIFGESGENAGEFAGKGMMNGENMIGGGVGSSDIALIYTDDSYSSYQNIFDNAKTDITDADKTRLIASLKQLNEGADIEDVVDTDAVIRYFVVHNFVCNFDSYTGSLLHNYYLYEKDGVLSMLPWDYNLAFGGFQSSSDASGMVNFPIDSPVSGGDTQSRPMLAWIFSNDEYTEAYHEYFGKFISEFFDSGYFETLMDETFSLISPYVEKDPTKFCTYEDFTKGFETLKEFCLLRAESVKGQLDGTVPSTSDLQSADSSSLIDASSIALSDMGSMQNGGGFGERGGNMTLDNRKI